MAVEVTTYFSGPFITNGATTVFPFTFISMDGDEIGVLLRDADGVDTIADTADYSVTRAADGTGSVVYASAPATGYDLYIFSDVSFSQSVEFEDGSGWKAAPVNSVADRSAARDIWLKGRVDRALLAPLGESPSQLPSVDNRAGKFLAFDAEGDPISSDGTGADDGLRTDLAAFGGSALVGFRQSGTGAPTRSAQSARRDIVSVSDFAVSDGITNDTAAFGYAITRASSVGGSLLLTGPVNVGTVRPDLKGVQILGTKPVTYDVALDYGKTVANRRGRDLGQSALGRSYLFRFWVYLSQFGDAGTANIAMYGDSVTESYVGPIVESFLATVSGVGTVTNDAISGTTIEQWRTGTGSYVASGKALSDWIAAPTEMLYIAFGINTPFFGGSPSSFAASLESALVTIRAAREVGETSIVVVLPIASRDGGAMSIEGGWKRDEYYVHALRELCEPLVDKYGICLFDPTVATPEADIDATGTNALNWLDATGVHPLFGNKYFVAGEIFDAICPTSMRSPVVAVDATANVTPSSGFTLPVTEIMRGIKRRDIVVTDGYIDMTTPATLTNGQNIAVLPAALRPAKFIRRVDLVLFNGSTFETIRGEVNNSTGQISAGQASSSSPQRVYLIGQWSAT